MIFISPPVSVKTPFLIALVTMVVGVSDAAAAQTVGLASAVEGRAITNSVGMKLVRIDPGTFTMGQDGPGVRDYKMETHPAEFDRADWDEKPAHPVTITRSFHLAATEVTVGQYRHFDPGFRLGKSAPDEAVSGISWTKAVEFCAWLTAREGRTYRLPTEAEWEYACRAGSSTLFSMGDVLPDGYLKWFGNREWRELYFPKGKLSPEYAWSEGPVTLRVAQKAANAWGLYDMHGNVAEWCCDWYGPYESGAQTDPMGRSDGDFRVFRGGSHSNLARLVRSANRSGWLPQAEMEDVGFRVVLGEPVAGRLLPPAPRPRNAQNVVQGSATISTTDPDVPFFLGPRAYVEIPPESYGPLFSRHNHSPALTECPNGDLLAVWYSCISEPGTELNNVAARLRAGAPGWDEPSLFWDGPDVNDHAPKLWWDGDRTLFHLTFSHTRKNTIRTSIDNGVTWSKARIIVPSAEISTSLIRTRDGSIVMTYDTGCMVWSRDGGETWQATSSDPRSSDIRPGGRGEVIAGIHSAIVELKDGRLMTIGRLNTPEERARFGDRTPVSFSSDFGKTWTYEASEFPAISNTQRQVMIRLREGPILICSFTDQWREWKNRKGLTFKSANGEFTGYGLFAALSYDEGRTWPHRRLVTPGGAERAWTTTDNTRCTLSDTMAEPTGYLAATQTRDGRIQVITSKNHYVFNLAWIQQTPSASRK